MAIAPESSETFAREVDENLRADKVRDVARTYGKWAILGVILLLVAIGAFLYYRDHQAKQRAADSEALAGVIESIGSDNLTTVPARVEPLTRSNSDAISTASRLTQAALALQQNDRPKAIKIYQQIAGDGGIASPWRDLATIRQTALEFDSLAPTAVVERLAPLAEPGKPWFGSAGEMTALALLKQNRRGEAGRMFAAVARDRTVPDSIRGRAVQIAGTLGVDTSAIIPTLAPAPAAAQ